MAKRFGRNQKRKLQERLDSAERVLAAAKSSYHDLWNENARLEAKLRRSIEIDVEVFRDRSRANYEARMEAHRIGYEGLYVAQRIDERELAMRRQQDEFIGWASQKMATALARAIGERW